MAGIIYDARRVKAYEGLQALGGYAGLDEAWCDSLWEELITQPDLFDEFIYYLEHHCIHGVVKCEGYSLLDLYVWQMNLYNIIGDVGKNTSACNKERMVLGAFHDMVEMRRNPAEYVKRMTEGRGLDK